MSQPRLSQLRLWQRHTSAVLAVLGDALMLLAASEVRGLEPLLNRHLILYMHAAMKTRIDAGLVVPEGLPMWEARNQPAPSSEDSASEGKIPDIQWGYFDSQANDGRSGGRHFHIECKRLGSAKLNRKYVGQGVRRFIDADWKYGKDVSDGAMVGYIIGQSADVILASIGAVVTSSNLPPLGHISDSELLRSCRQTLVRSFAKSPFTLSHYWVDMREIAPRTTVEEIADVQVVAEGA